METDEKLQQLEQDYNEYVLECTCALKSVMAAIDGLRLQQDPNNYDLFDNVHSRIKTVQSTYNKCLRRGYEPTIEEIRAKIRDVAGVRIVPPFRDNVYEIEEMIERQPGITIVEKKDYYEHPKENGYASLHLIVMVEIYWRGHSRMVPVEIQIRDGSMNFWARLEHIIKYKKTCYDPRATKFFIEMAQSLNHVAEIAMEFRDHETEDPNNDNEDNNPENT